MFQEPNESPSEPPGDPAERAREKSDQFRMHAELAAVFEATRKFDAVIMPGLDAKVAREIQQAIGKLEKSKTPDSPVLPASSASDAAALLDMPKMRDLSTNDYHIYRRPGEVMILRWLAGDEVEAFYSRLQAHFDAAIEGCREDERQSLEWKQDPQTRAYLESLDALNIRMAERYLREPIRAQNWFVLSTQSADEINIAYLADYLMSVSPAEIVGEASAPPLDPTESDLAWFFKLFSLRGVKDSVEQMCFFTYLQKANDEDW